MGRGGASLLLALLSLTGATFAAEVHRTPLEGEWRFAMDPEDRGLSERWFTRTLEGRIRLPGALQNQGFGLPVAPTTDWVSTLHDRYWWRREEYKSATNPIDVWTPFQLQPKLQFLGAAFFQRQIVIPPAWVGRRTELNLERVHWKSDVWIDERHVGSCDSLGTPHVFDLGSLTAGSHVLTIRVDNRMIVDVGRNAHSVTDATQGRWNGIVGEISLRSRSAVYLEDVQVFPKVATQSARVVVEIGNVSGRFGAGQLMAGTQTTKVQWTDAGGRAEIEVPLGPGAATWDEFRPALQRLTIRLQGDGADDTREVVFGLREIATSGTQFALNGRPIYLRGTHDGAVFPLTGYPATDVESWRRIIRTAQAHGLNHMRFHSWCPPEAAFIAADELGFYLQPECSIWARDGVRLDPESELARWLQKESERMVKAYGNHPSFLFLSHGNEPEGRWAETLSTWVHSWRQRDPRRLYAAATGAPMKHELGPVSGTDYYVVSRIGKDRVRGEGGWNGKDYRVAVEGTNVPIVSHELGQYSSYPDLHAAERYTGALRPRFLEIFRESLRKNGLAGQERDFAVVSGRLQALAYKEEIEACLRTPGHAGFQLLDIRDYPGQGYSPVGVLDPFWNTKGYISAERYRRFCNSTVPLARLSSRTLAQPSVLKAEVEVAHFGPQALPAALLRWRVEDRGRVVLARGTLPPTTLSIGNGQKVGSIEIATQDLPAPAAYRLFVGIDGTSFENDWDFWVYPAPELLPKATGIVFARSLDAATVAELRRGGKVLLFPRPEELPWESSPFTFAPIFWNRQLFPRWDRSLGLIAGVNHPALALFPSEGYSDWQWAPLIQTGCRALSMSGLPSELKPFVQAIDDWNRNERQGLLFEARVEGGSLLVSAFDLTRPESPAQRQMLASLTSYMASDRFAPSVSVTLEQLRSLFFDAAVMKRIGARAVADSEAEGGGAGNAIDGNPETAWATPRGADPPDWPHTLSVSLDREVTATGLALLAPQRDRKRVGEIADYVVETSQDGTTWAEAARGRLKSTYRTQTVAFSSAVPMRHLRLIALSNHDDSRVATLAEMTLLLATSDPASESSITEEGERVLGQEDELETSPTTP